MPLCFSVIEEDNTNTTIYALSFFLAKTPQASINNTSQDKLSLPILLIGIVTHCFYAFCRTTFAKTAVFPELNPEQTTELYLRIFWLVYLSHLTLSLI